MITISSSPYWIFEDAAFARMFVVVLSRIWFFVCLIGMVSILLPPIALGIFREDVR